MVVAVTISSLMIDALVRAYQRAFATFVSLNVVVALFLLCLELFRFVIYPLHFQVREGINVYRFANRIPLLFEAGADVVTQVITY